MNRLSCPSCHVIIYNSSLSETALTTCVVHTQHFDGVPQISATPHIASCLACLNDLEAQFAQKYCGRCHQMGDHYSFTVIPKGYPLNNPRSSIEKLFFLGFLTISIQLISHKIGTHYLPAESNEIEDQQQALFLSDCASTLIVILLMTFATIPFVPTSQENSTKLPHPFFSQAISITTGLTSSFPYGMVMHAIINMTTEPVPIELSQSVIYLQALLAAHFAIEKHKK